MKPPKTRAAARPKAPARPRRRSSTAKGSASVRPEAAPSTPMSRVRLGVVGLVLVSAAAAVGYRAYAIQVAAPEQYRRNYREEVAVHAKRGNIYDRNGTELAVSVELESFFADPETLRIHEVDVEALATTLHRILGVERKTLLRRLASDKRFVWLRRRVAPKLAAQVHALGFDSKGLGVRMEPRRFYPSVQTAAHVLGFVDGQGRGVEGIERTFDTHLRGAVDRVAAVVDAHNRVVFSEELLDPEAAQGHDLTLTLDRALQAIAEEELALGARTVEATAGTVVVMDPSTGEVLAMANYPTFNPNEPGKADPAARRNRAVTDRFEPGSTVKPFTVAGALTAGTVSPTQRIACEEGEMQVAEHVIHDSHRWESLTPAQILAFSSNIGTAKIAASLGRPGLFRTFRRFGFGERTEVPLPAEASGILRHYKGWYDMDAATISFGQGMSATALQLTGAMAALANGGRLMRPMVVRSIADASGRTIEEFSPGVLRQVVPSRVARLVSDMLTAVTGPGGTGEAAAVDGYLAAGKTGTAQKADYVRGGYSEDQWTASFVGFVPADKPRLVITVVIDEPVIEHYGGTVAGPVFRRIADRSLRHLGVPASYGGSALASLAKQHRDRAEALAQELAEVEVEAVEEVKAPAVPLKANQVHVPELEGLGARQVLTRLHEAGLTPQLTGTGAAFEQQPSAGEVVARDTLVRVQLTPPYVPEDAPPMDQAATADGTRLAHAGARERDD